MLSSQAAAQTWSARRESEMRDSSGPRHSIKSFTFELRFGGYSPMIDSDAGLAQQPCGGPYTCYFGKGPQFYFGLELDWLPIRIPYVGKIGPAFGWGFVTFNGKGHNPASTNWGENWQEDSDAVAGSTGMSLMPMHASAAIRIDEIARRTVIPLVPYAKLGFGFGTWSTRTGALSTDVNKDAKGFSLGPHIALGGMLGLNFLDRRSASMARENSGILQAYVFGEWMYDDLSSGLGEAAMNIGSSSWVIGLALDL